MADYLKLYHPLTKLITPFGLAYIGRSRSPPAQWGDRDLRNRVLLFAKHQTRGVDLFSR